ncbi:ADA regulatory protein [Marinobacter nitratireducens]|uniref:ADA regulatory protein n=1 Tax=Marinobacter nitratireducens TaxID=1137280 RepID=A0A072N1J4_9GAMM|nr:bifunctional DNA-binding transcriptional regulator/O6-methylguanine-DNA methyltransferase Ada [Marinobacter nitratireducens]KEF30818.1 ADA regulatory protein [Marinobacter nitratireducens]
MTVQGSEVSDYGTDEARWQAIVGRDERADNCFVYAVRTTGVYCRPSATSRLPKRENVEFFDSADLAEKAGYRPSRRPQGDRTAVVSNRIALVREACRLIESSEDVPDLRKLAAQARLSPHYFHRVFKAETGLTPKAYAIACRARKVRDELGAAEGTVTDAIYGAGYNSSSRFYESSAQVLGMRAGEYRAGGAGVVIRFAVGECTLGSILVAQSERGVCAILLGDEPDALVRDLQDRFPKAELIGGDRAFERMVAEVVGVVEAPGTALNLPLDIQGTVFQQRVWEALREIPVGVTVSYSDLAERIGEPKAVRAVARACGANCLAVAIPCHRVVRRDGALSGYRWGVERKRELLRREAGL